MIINGQDQDIRADIPILNDLWQRYYDQLGKLYGDRYLKSKIKTNGFATGQLEASLASQLANMVEKAEVFALTEDDAKVDFAYSPNIAQYEDAINAAHRHIHLTPDMLWQINKLTHTLDPIIQDTIGTRWRALNVRIWKTPAFTPDKVIEGSLDWHDDGMPKDMLKLLVYLTDLSPETGSVEWKISKNETSTLIGPAGAWLLFQNSVVFHRGLPPSKAGAQRIMLEITLTPSAINKPNVVHGGYNARHPWRFWQTDFS